MQAASGLLPLPPPPPVFPGMISSAMAQGGGAAGFFAGAQQIQSFPGVPMMVQGPTGLAMPVGPSAPYNPYASGNPYSNLGALRGANQPSPYTPFPPMPPPAYGGPAGQLAARPFSPMPAGSWFDTPFNAALNHGYAASERQAAMGIGGMGMAARLAADSAAALAGMGAARHFGFGGGVGRAVGAIGGFMGSELSGLAQGAQNLAGSWFGTPALAERVAATGLRRSSTGFVFGGQFGDPSGSGFNPEAAHTAARNLIGMSNSASFRQDTLGRFNQNDVMSIAQQGGAAGLMSGVQSPGEMNGRVREIARSLSAFMELAREPDIQRAISTMGSLRSSGLNLSETMQAVSQGRTFARMAGTSFQEMSALGGAQGSSVFGSMGLSQGLGFMRGMGAYGQASAAQNLGVLSPQVMAMMGGAQGLGGLNTMFSGGFLQSPMLAPGLMTSGGGLNVGSIRQMLSGGADLFRMAGTGTDALGGMARRQGIEGLGMALGMQPMLQDTIGRMMAMQGPFAQRNTEDASVMNLMRSMNMRGGAGFMSAAQIMGMDRTQAYARAMEMSSPRYYESQRTQLATARAEQNSQARRLEESRAPGLFTQLAETTGLGDAYARFDPGGAMRDFVGNVFGHHSLYMPETDAAARRLDSAARSGGFGSAAQGSRGFLSGQRATRLIARSFGARGLLSGVSGLAMGGMSDGEIDSHMDSLSAGGTYSEALLNSGRMDARDAARRDQRRFGGATAESARLAFSQELLSMRPGGFGAGTSTVANTAFRGLGMLATGGMVDPGNITGPGTFRREDFENAFVRSFVSSGRGDAQQARAAIRGGAINDSLAMASTDIRLFGSETMRQSLQQSRDIGAEARGLGRTNFRESQQRDEESALEQLTGVRRGGRADSFRSFMDQVRGVGREGSASYDRSRYFVATGAMLSRTAQTGGAGDREAGFRRYQELLREAQREGIDTTELRSRIEDAASVAARQGADMDRTSRQFTDARGNRSARSIIDGFQRLDAQRIRAAAGQRVATGVEQTGRLGGAFSVFSRFTAANFDERDFASTVQGLSQDQLNAMRDEGGAFGSQFAQYARRLQRGDRSAVGDLRSLTSRFGAAQRRAAEQEYDQSHTGFFGFMRHQLGEIFGSGREGAIQQSLLNMSPEARRTALQMGNTTALEDRARSSGVGRAEDAMLRASENINDAANALRDSVQGNVGRALVSGTE